MKHLISAAACLKQLKETGTYTCTASYFSQLVTDGKFPTHSKPNSPKKWFKYEEVENVVKTFSSVAQNTPVIQKEYADDSLLGQVGKFPSVADMTSKELKERLAKEADDLEKVRQQIAETGIDMNNLPPSDAFEESEFLGKTLNEVKIQKEFWLGKKAEIEYKKQRQELVSIDDVNQNAFEVARLIRDNLAGMSGRLTAMISSENDPHVIRTLIDEEVNKTLSSVSEVIYE